TPLMSELAGGEDVEGRRGEPSYTTGWEELQVLAPEVVIGMPCGYDAARAHDEALEHADSLALLRARRIVAVDAAAYFSRPGPRLTEGVELLGHILHPECLPSAPAAARALAVEPLTVAG